ncbi:MAG: serine protease, partial [Pseudomonadota bacterium]
MRLHFAEFSNPDEEHFELVIRTASLKVFSYTQDTLPGANFWTPMLAGDSVLIQIRAESVPRAMSFRVDKVAYQSPGGSWESIIEDPDFEEIIKYDKNLDITRVADAVAKLTFFDNGFDSCTGFMISRNRMMTNHHCVSTLEVCETTMAIFDFHIDKLGNEVYGDQYACNKVLVEDYDLDFAVLELQGNPGDKYGFLSFAPQEISRRQKLYIVQHADGQPKQIVKENCRVIDPIADGRVANSDFTHTCDTLGGSSGSPVIGADHRVVGLHHFGINQA